MSFATHAVTIAFAMSLAASALAQSPAGTPVKINQIQVIGTHNSYHAGIAPSEAQIWKAKSPETFAGLDYQHAPLTRQFNNGIARLSWTSSPIARVAAMPIPRVPPASLPPAFLRTPNST